MKKLVIVGMLISCMLFVFSESYAQNLFVVSAQDGYIYKYTSDGTRSTFASGLNSPQGLAFDGVGNLFVVDGNGSIFKYTPEGARSFFAQGLSSPSGLAVNSLSDVILANWYGGIDVFTSNGAQGIRVSEVSTPFGITLNTTGNLFVASRGEGKVYEYTSDWVQSIHASGLNSPSGLAFDSKSNLFVGEPIEGRIIRITPEGEQSIFASGINIPIGLAFDRMGNLFAVSQGDNSVYKFTPNGVMSTFASGLRVPSYLAFEPVTAPPLITLQPKSQTAAIGSTVYLTVQATNSPMSYQWFFGTNIIVGATNSLLTLTNLHSGDSGNYTVVVSNTSGSVTSNPAMLMVLPSLDIHMTPRILLNCEIGMNCSIEYISPVGPTNAWVSLAIIAITNNPQYYFDVLAIGQPARFYRLQQVP